MNRREFISRGLESLVVGLFIPGCVKDIVGEPQPQRKVSPLLQIPNKTRTLYIDVKSRRISSAYVYAPFDEAKDLLNEKNFIIISSEDNAYLRMQKGAGSFIFEFGNFTKEGFVYVPQKGVYLVKNSPVLDYPATAANAHKNGVEFYIEQVEKALEDSVRVPYDLGPIPTNRLAEEEVASYLFGEQAKLYGEFLSSAGIKEMPLWLVGKSNEQSKPFVRQLWFGGRGCRSGINGNSNYLGICARVRGIKK